MVISFETYQVISFALASSLFLYLTVTYVKWVIKEMNKNARPARR